MAKLLGIDVGTSGTKAIVIDEHGRVLKRAFAEYPLSIPQPGWSEQDPEDWWKAVQSCLVQIDEPDIDAIGLAGQMHGAVFLDEAGKVIRPAILWNDQRTAKECEEINEAVGPDEVKRITGNPPLTGFQLPKILWLRRHEPTNYVHTRKVLLPKDYIRFRLTGVMATEVSDASGTGLLDVPHRKWSGAMMNELGIDPSWLPEVFESSEITAKTDSGVPVVGGGGDQAASAVGTGAVSPGILSVSLGTSGVIFGSLDKPAYDAQGRAHTFCHANGAWHAMTVMLSCGGAVRWLRDTIFPGEEYDEITALASAAPSGSRGVTFLPYLSGERSPHIDPLARGAFNGLSLAAERSDIARAVFEGVTFGLFDGLMILKELGLPCKELRVTGGGARSEFWLQLLADTFTTRVTTVESDEGPAMGAAILAGVGIGLWSDVKSANDATIRLSTTIEPKNARNERSWERYKHLYRAVREWNHTIP